MIRLRARLNGLPIFAALACAPALAADDLPTAHVTLLRHARCEKARDLPAGDLRIEWPVRDFVLVESDLQPEGANYRILGRWPLAQT